MDDAKNPPWPTGPYDPEAWARWAKDVMAMRNESATGPSADEQFASMLARQVLETFNLGQPVSQLVRVLPRDVKALRDFAVETGNSLERRARVLEVVILRGAHAQWPYEVMVSLLDGPLLMDQQLRRETEEKLVYQRVALDLVMQSEPKLFEQLSSSTDRLPAVSGGRYAATEWMNTNLQEGGLLGMDHVRDRVFIPWLQTLPARDRGRAMFHLKDAAGAQERGRVTFLGYVEASAMAAAFGLTWVVADPGWHQVTDGVLGNVEHGLGYSHGTGPDPARARDREEFYRGYILAGRGLATPGSTER